MAILFSHLFYISNPILQGELLMNSVSFGSTYKVSSKNNDYLKQSKFIEFGMKKFGENTEFRDYLNGPRVVTIVAPDRKDSKVEDFCKCNGIKFTKLTNDYLLSTSEIDKRVRSAEGNMVKVYVNVEKLEELAKTQKNNFDHCENDYKKYYKNLMDKRLKTGNAFSAASLSLYPLTSKDDLMNYIDDFGADMLNKNMIDLTLFSREHDENEQCMYAALKDKGFKHIPVYMYQESYEIASKLGILEDGISK